MTSPRPTVRRRFLAGLVPLLLALGVLPLMAPTCGTMGPGDKTFARLSLVIPMDLCYQYTTDEISGTAGYPVSGCPQAAARGDVIKAYGLVYRLVRAGVPVYWVIANGKSAVNQIDMSIQFNGGPPVMSFDWAANNMSTTARPTAGSKIDYRGGPFVIDASDFKAAQKVFLDYGKTFSVVNVHVANVAFTGHVAKVMAGGWSAGGTVPPKLALLDIGSSGAVIAENSENVIQGYLKRAGLDTADAGGTASGTHGQIYDRLVMEDFVSPSGDWTATNLYKNGYKILWIPHWSAPTSCSDCTADSCPCTNKYPSTTVAKALANMGAFFNAGNDVFAECAGLGSFEGVFSGDTSHFQSAYGPGNAATHFQTGTTTVPAGLWANMWGGGTVQDAVLVGQYDSPLMQLGDYPFKALNGAIADFKPAGNPATYRTGVTRYISYKNDTSYDVFTMLAGVTGGHGAAVYLGGHSYDGKDQRTGAPGAYMVAGERLVLNTLFNLGAGCVSTGQACSTGLLGECAVGAMQCNAQGELVCNQVHPKAPSEICDGKDNDCNGMVDDELDEGCYEGPDGTADVGICRSGVKSCILKSDGTYGMSACTGQVLPDPTESCNGLDDTCRGHADQVQNGSGVWTALTQPCYDGGPQTLDPITGQPRGVCKGGLATCTAGTWGACQVCEDLYPTDSPPPWQNRNAAKYASCQILPELQQSCSYPTLDMTCSGSINASCGCTGAAPTCYDGPSNTLNTGGSDPRICHAGVRVCVGSSWGTCTGQVTPAPRDCTNGKDNVCNGIIDADGPACQSACPGPGSEALICRVPAVPRYTTDCANGTQMPPCTKHIGDPMGMCTDGTRACANGSFGECSGLMLPAPEICDGKDNNCDGRVDENPDTLCSPGFTCKRGVCIPSSCGAEALCPLGWKCNASGTCDPDVCNISAAPANQKVCAVGEACRYEDCVNPCDPVTGPDCAPGSACSGGHCVGGGCYLSGCPVGETCSEGVCVADPCSRQTCPSGTFCRAGDCVQSCVYQTCAEGQICGADGFCGADPCLPNPCTGGDVCVNDNGTAACVQDKCAGLSCGPRQLCDPTTGKCKDDPCNAVTCPVGACTNGQCYSVAKPDTSKPGTNTTTESEGAPGCGCGQGSASPLAALLFLLLVPLARRRSRAAAALGPARRAKAGRTTLLTLLALVALTAQACGKGGGSSSTSTIDLSKCHETCGEQRCIDVNFDPAHCGGCANVCDAGQVCKDGGCGPSAAVAPFLRSIDPTTGSPGLIEPLEVTLTGDRFDPAAVVRVISPTGSAPLTTHYDTGTGQLHAELNLYDIGPTALQLRVVNPDHVISNALTFSVESIGATIADVQPRSVPKGSSAVLKVTGEGFTPTSECFHTGGTNGIPMATTVHTESGTPYLTCTFDATTLPIDNYELWVVNDQTASSAHFQYVAVQSAQPQLFSVSPSTGTMDAAADILLVGSGFDTTSQAYIAWSSLSRTDTPVTTFVDSTHLLVARYVPPHAATSPLSGSITVHNGSKISGAQPFSAVSSAPTLVTMAAAPFVGSPAAPQAGAPIYQGDKVRITFTWNSPDTATKITVTGPDGTIYPALTPTPTGSTTTAYADVTLSTGGTGWPQGTYGTTVTFGSSAGTSSSYSFRVLSNVAVLRSIDPAGGQQGATVNPLKLSVANSNLHGTSSTVLLKGPLPAKTTVRSVTLAPGATTIALKLATDAVPSVSYDTGTYTISVQNPGAAVSNEVSFTVLPGSPAISGLSVNGGASTKTACVVQSQTATSIVVNGTNFAKPDAQGRGGSQLMYTEYPVTAQSTWAPLDASVYTVASSTQISAPAFDTRNALADHTYQLSVWNAPGPMKSTDVVTLKVASSSCP